MNSEIVKAILNRHFVTLLADVLRGEFVQPLPSHLIPELIPNGYNPLATSARELTLFNFNGALSGLEMKYDVELRGVEERCRAGISLVLAKERAQSRKRIVDELLTACLWSVYPDLVGESVFGSGILGSFFVPANVATKPKWPVKVFPQGTNPAGDFLKDLLLVVEGKFPRPDDATVAFFKGADHCCGDRCDVENDDEYIALRDHRQLWQYVWLMAKLLADKSRYMARHDEEREHWEVTKTSDEIALLDVQAGTRGTLIQLVEHLLFEEAMRLKPSIQPLARAFKLAITKDGFIVRSRNAAAGLLGSVIEFVGGGD